MKRKMLMFLCTLISVICCAAGLTSCGNIEQGSGQETNENTQTPTEGLEYTLSDDGTYYICSGLSGVTETDIVISSTYNGKPVTHIGNGAFRQCSSLTSVIIPNSVTTIGGGAFSGCSGLKSINIPNSVTLIDGSAFCYCSGLESVNISDSVTTIGLGAFGGCSNLTSITIPDSVTAIGSYAFEKCDSLQYNEYGNALYLGNTNNPYLVLIESKNKEITSCTINEKTKLINSVAFDKCSLLKNIIMSDSVIFINWYAFKSCTALTNITFKGTKEQWEAIRKVVDWDNDTGNYTVHCTDGDIAKE